MTWAEKKECGAQDALLFSNQTLQLPLTASPIKRLLNRHPRLGAVVESAMVLFSASKGMAILPEKTRSTPPLEHQVVQVKMVGTLFGKPAPKKTLSILVHHRTLREILNGLASQGYPELYVPSPGKNERQNRSNDFNYEQEMLRNKLAITS